MCLIQAIYYNDNELGNVFNKISQRDQHHRITRNNTEYIDKLF